MISQSSRCSLLVLATRVYMRKITSTRAIAPKSVTGIRYIEELFVYGGIAIAEFMIATTIVVGVSRYRRTTGTVMGNGERGSRKRVNSGAGETKGI